ncbi:MAG: hypothetical protein JNL62_17755, partial [Bryobacterales bacterium]|nr:hypothetical protein [Bryobacterales bacterium]
MSTLFEQSAPALYVCGLGSSAGGLEALSAFFPHVPHTGRFAFIVAQHLAPQHPSMLAELLSREAALDVIEVKNGIEIEADVVYVTPPAWDVEVEGGKIWLREPDSRLPKPSVDRLLESIARQYGETGLAVILSGTGSDGSRGAHAVKSARGQVFVQDPSSARYEGMPTAALDTGCATASDAAERLWRCIEGWFFGNEPRWKLMDRQALVEGVLQEIRRVTGVDFRGYKRGTLARRMQRRMRALGVEDASLYLETLKEDANEARKLCQSCLISVTGFFRDPKAFARLRHHLAAHLARSANDTVRIWVSGCATGEEAYSLAMLCHDIAPQRRIQIFATDIDADAVETARRAVYSDAKLRSVDAAFREQYFLGERRAFKVVKFIRDMVVFARHDALRDPLFVNLDLISCRNFLIYLRPAMQIELLRKFHYALRPEGMLFLGKPETAPEDVYETLEPRARIFRAKPRAAPVKASFPLHGKRPERIRATPSTPSGRSEQLRSVLFNQFAPAAVLIDSTMRILETHGEVGRYLTLKSGGVDMTLLSLAPKTLQAALRAQLYHCRRSGKLSRSFPRPVEIQNRMTVLQTVVAPAPASTPQDPLFVVAFAEVPQLTPITADTIEVSSDRDRQLERDLLITRENLHSAIEELETSNEELQTLNEELQSNNEELQATNEEFQAANEELHSTNEELVTVNEELEQKSLQLAAAVEDLSNIQNSLHSPMLVVDSACQLRHANLAAEKELGLAPGIDRPLVLSMDHDLGLKLEAQVRKVMASGRASEWKAMLGRKHFNVITHPYQPHEGASCSGAVVLFHDTTGLVKANQRTQASEARLRAMSAQQTAIINGIPAQVALIGPDGHIRTVNEQWRSFSENYPVFGESLLVGKNLVRIFAETSGDVKDPAQGMAIALQKILAGNNQGFS